MDLYWKWLKAKKRKTELISAKKKESKKFPIGGIINTTEEYNPFTGESISIIPKSIKNK